MEEKEVDPADAKKTNALAENLAAEALNSKTVLEYNGNNIDVTNIDGKDNQL